MGAELGQPGHFPPGATSVDACEVHLELGFGFLETLAHASLLLGATE